MRGMNGVPPQRRARARIRSLHARAQVDEARVTDARPGHSVGSVVVCKFERKIIRATAATSMKSTDVGATTMSVMKAAR